MIATENLYLNADKTKVLRENDPDIAFVLAGEGGVIPEEYRDLPGLKSKTEEATNELLDGTVLLSDDPTAHAVADTDDTKAVSGPDATKALSGPDAAKLVSTRKTK